MSEELRMPNSYAHTGATANPVRESGVRLYRYSPYHAMLQIWVTGNHTSVPLNAREIDDVIESLRKIREEVIVDLDAADEQLAIGRALGAL